MGRETETGSGPAGRPACRLIHRCRSEKCGPDVYLVPGWDRTLPAIRGREGRLDAHIGDLLADRNVYFCSGLPYYESHHDPVAIADALLDEISERSGEAVDVVGSSFGGVVAQLAKVKDPEGVGRVALLHSFDTITPFEGVVSRETAENLFKRIIGSELGKRVLGLANVDLDAETEESFERLFDFDVPEEIARHAGNIYALNCGMDSALGKTPDLPEDRVRRSLAGIHHILSEGDVGDLAAFLSPPKGGAPRGAARPPDA